VLDGGSENPQMWVALCYHNGWQHKGAMYTFWQNWDFDTGR